MSHNNNREQINRTDSNLMINSIEEESGPISYAIKALLVTDGSVTKLLECFNNSPVSIRTITQNIIKAPDDIADDLQVRSGDLVNYRVVEICDKEMDIPLIHAISYSPVSRLPDYAKKSLMQADIPIGVILRDEKIESRREITNIRTLPESDIPAIFQTGNSSSRTFSRKYNIIHQNLPLFRIEEYIPEYIFSDAKQVTIRTPSRLHLALIDMNGSLGRVDGGVGITLDRPGYTLTAEYSSEPEIIADSLSVKTRISNIVSDLSKRCGYNPDVKIRVNESIPFHMGLGSGTQISLAVATAMSLLSGKRTEDPAGLTGRGGTSGVGVRSFAEGGVIVDGGHRFGPGKDKTEFLPSSASKGVHKSPLIGRYEFPKKWKIILCLPDIPQGACNDKEKDIFKEYCPVPLSDVEKISHLVLMQMIPALVEEDLDQFGRAVNELRNYGFKKKEIDLQPGILHNILDFMTECGTCGAGMSSFGPALYAFTDTNGTNLASDISSYLNDYCDGETKVVRGNNSGAIIRG